MVTATMLSLASTPLRDHALSWDMRVPSGERLYRMRGARVNVLLTRELTVLVTRVHTVHILGHGEWNYSSVYWHERDKRGLCWTAAEMVSGSVADVLAMFRRGYLPLTWVDSTRRHVL